MTLPDSRAASGSAVWGDLHMREDGRLDGWCWSPADPQARMLVELLADDRVVIAIVAAQFRADLLARGCGDGWHGFAVFLPPNLPEMQRECLISARERRTGRVFGRLLRPSPLGAAAHPGVQRAAAAVAELTNSVAALRHRIAAPTPEWRLRAAFGQLSAVMAPCALRLPRVAQPRLSVVLLAGGEVSVAEASAALAPALSGAAAEVLLLDPADAGRDIIGAVAQAARTARGHRLVLLDVGPCVPSAAALLALSRLLAQAGPELLLAAAAAELAGALAAPDEAAPLSLPARLGLLVGGETSLFRVLGAAAETKPISAAAGIALRARLLGRRWRRVMEPQAAPAPPQPIGRLRTRWGA